jgi:hypothetical protein
MLYLQKSQVNTLVLNINNNSRDTFTGYSLTFTHVMSKESKTYVVETNNISEFYENIRYCTITLNFVNPGQNLNYLGQYVLNIYGLSGSANQLVFNGMVVLEGTQESEPFTQYISPNETNENYIYIQE